MVAAPQLKPSIKGCIPKILVSLPRIPYSDIFQAGLGGGIMKFDDGNLRKANFG